MNKLQAWGILSVSGPDRTRFLQGQLSCDVESLPVNQSCLGTHCSPKGRVIANFRIWQDSEQFYFFLPRDQIPFLFQSLKKYAIFSKVALTDLSDQIHCYSWVHDAFAAMTLPAKNHELFIGATYTLIRVSDRIPRGLLLTSSPDAIQLPHTLTDEAWLRAEIDEGFPHVFASSKELFTPHHLHYHVLGGISFNKGCYTGQEVIARMHYLGKLKQQLYKAVLKADALPSPGEAIFKEEQEVGNIVMAVKDGEENIHSALILLREDASAELTTLTFQQGKGTIIQLTQIHC